MKAELLTKDGSALFDVANNFDIRHRRADQKTDYDPVFLEWIFFWHLRTIDLVSQFVQREREASEVENDYPF